MIFVRQTSRLAYEAIHNSGLLSRMRCRVYDCLYQHGPMTAGELTHMLKGPNEVHPSYHRRLDELAVLGVAQRIPGGERPCKVTGYVCTLWDVTDALPAGAVKALARPSLFARAAAVAEIRKLQNAGHTSCPMLDEVADWLEGLS